MQAPGEPDSTQYCSEDHRHCRNEHNIVECWHQCGPLAYASPALPDDHIHGSLMMNLFTPIPSSGAF